MNASQSRFVVVDENMLGCIHPRSQLSVQVLSASIIRGASVTAGMYPLPLDPDWVRSSDCPKPLDLAKVRAGTQAVKLDSKHVRPATRADFETFRLVSTGYENDPAYAFPIE